MKKTSLLLAVSLLSSCAMSPHIGMSFADWQEQCRGHSWTKGALVAARDNVEIYRCDDSTLYGFVDGELVEVGTPDPVPGEALANSISGAAMMFMGLELMDR